MEVFFDSARDVGVCPHDLWDIEAVYRMLHGEDKPESYLLGVSSRKAAKTRRWIARDAHAELQEDMQPITALPPRPCDSPELSLI